MDNSSYGDEDDFPPEPRSAAPAPSPKTYVSSTTKALQQKVREMEMKAEMEGRRPKRGEHPPNPLAALSPINNATQRDSPLPRQQRGATDDSNQQQRKPQHYALERESSLLAQRQSRQHRFDPTSANAIMMGQGDDGGDLYEDWKGVIEQRRDQQTARFHTDLKHTAKAVRLLEQLVDPDGKEAAAAAGRGAAHKQVHERLRDLRIENSELQLGIDQLSRKLLATIGKTSEENSNATTLLGQSKNKPSSFTRHLKEFTEAAYETVEQGTTKDNIEKKLAAISVDLALAIRKEKKPLGKQNASEALVPSGSASTFSGKESTGMTIQLPAAPPASEEVLLAAASADDSLPMRSGAGTLGPSLTETNYGVLSSSGDADASLPQLAQLTRQWVEYNCALQQELSMKKKMLKDIIPAKGSNTVFGRSFATHGLNWLSVLEAGEKKENEQLKNDYREISSHLQLSLGDPQGMLIPLVLPPSLPSDSDGWRKWKDELLTETECRGNSEEREAWIRSVISSLDHIISLEMTELLEACNTVTALPMDPNMEALLLQEELRDREKQKQKQQQDRMQAYRAAKAAGRKSPNFDLPGRVSPGNPVGGSNNSGASGGSSTNDGLQRGRAFRSGAERRTSIIGDRPPQGPGLVRTTTNMASARGKEALAKYQAELKFLRTGGGA